MSVKLTPELLRVAAEIVSLPLSEDEVGPVLDRLQVLLDGTDQIAHLTENTAELDVRFNAFWEVEAV
jgi:hypothetical protein